MVAPVILSVVAFIAGHPTNVVCDPTLNGHEAALPGARGWTATGGNTVFVIPRICGASADRVGSPEFAEAISVFIHEAARARGLKSDSCVEMMADVGVFDVVRRFYRVPFFSSLSREIGAQVLALTRRLPGSYQPESCWATGTVS